MDALRRSLDVGRQRDVTLLGQVGLTLVGRARQERLHCCGGVRVVALGADDRVRGENQRVCAGFVGLEDRREVERQVAGCVGLELRACDRLRGRVVGQCDCLGAGVDFGNRELVLIGERLLDVGDRTRCRGNCLCNARRTLGALTDATGEVGPCARRPSTVRCRVRGTSGSCRWYPRNRSGSRW